MKPDNNVSQIILFIKLLLLIQKNLQDVSFILHHLSCYKILKNYNYISVSHCYN